MVAPCPGARKGTYDHPGASEGYMLGGRPSIETEDMGDAESILKNKLYLRGWAGIRRPCKRRFWNSNSRERDPICTAWHRRGVGPGGPWEIRDYLDPRLRTGRAGGGSHTDLHAVLPRRSLVRRRYGRRWAGTRDSNAGSSIMATCARRLRTPPACG